MVEPPKFQNPPTRVNPETGELEMLARDMLPWSLDTLQTAGDIRSNYMRLQAWVAATLNGDKK